MATIDYTYFKKYLIKYNIKLFDANYRIAHFRYNNLIQSGGSSNLLKKVNRRSYGMLYNFIIALLDNDTTKLNWILTNI